MPSRLPNPPRPALVDTIAGLLAILGNLGVTLAEGDSPGYRPIDAGAVAIMVGAGLALMWTRRAPRLVLAVTTGLLVLYALRDYTGGPIYLAPLFSIYSLAARDGRYAASIPALVSTVLLSVPAIVWDSEDPPIVHFFYLTWVGAALFLGEAARNRRLYVAGVEERARYLEETREQEASRRVAEERLRIARDLHDSVAHSLASISVQAGAGAHVAERRPEDAHAALVAIRQASQEALAELRATLGLLRSAGADGEAPTSPVRPLSRLDGLLAGARGAGLQVDLHVDGEAPPPGDPAEEAAYRIVQEALTNTLRHAGPARVRVTLRHRSDAIEVEVLDDGMGPGDPAAVTPGHGLVGMRERAAELGGSLQAGPGPAGGFRVHALLPWQEAERPVGGTR